MMDELIYTRLMTGLILLGFMIVSYMLVEYERRCRLRDKYLKEMKLYYEYQRWEDDRKI